MISHLVRLMLRPLVVEILASLIFEESKGHIM